jgi:hypothetical protein
VEKKEVAVPTDDAYALWDSRTGAQQGFDTLAAARAALQAWVSLQRNAGEPVVEHPTGQWSDSRITTWLADRDGKIIRLQD